MTKNLHRLAVNMLYQYIFCAYFVFEQGKQAKITDNMKTFYFLCNNKKGAL